MTTTITEVESNKSLNNFKKYIAELLDEIEDGMVYKRPGSENQIYMKSGDDMADYKVAEVEYGTGAFVIKANDDHLSYKSLQRLREMSSATDPDPTAEDLRDQEERGWGGRDMGQSKRRGRESIPRPGGSGARMGSIYKRFSQDEAGYVPPGSPNFDRTHKQCKDCVHFDDHGNCSLVPNIDGDGYCEEFFADIGVFGHNHGDYVEENLVLWGEIFDWDLDQAKEFGGDIREILQRKLR